MIEKPRVIICPGCDGSGQKSVEGPTAKFTSEPCADCNGTGKLEALTVIQNQ